MSEKNSLNQTTNSRRSGLKIMGKLIGLVRPLFHIMTAAVLLGIAGFLASIFITVLGASAVAKTFDVPLTWGFIGSLTTGKIFILIGLCALFRGILRYGEQTCNHYIAFKLLALIRDRVFSALRRLCPAKLEGRDKGNLISIITSDVELLEVFYAHTISPIIIAVFTSLIMCLFIGKASPLLGLFAAISYGIIGILIPTVNSKCINQTGMDYRNQIGQMNTVFLDGLRGLPELIQFQKANWKLKEIQEITGQTGVQHRKLKTAEGITRSVTDLAILLFSGGIIIFSLYLQERGIVSTGDALIASVSLMSSFGPVVALSNLSNNLAQTLACGERVLSLLEETPEVPEIIDGKNIVFDSAKCRHVNFSYDDTQILKDISLTIPRGSIVGIHGKSGSGKSTILKLLMRFWDKDSGQILLSGTEIGKVNTNSLRSNESYCTQDTYLFNDTIGNNIRLGRLDASDEELVEAAKKASIHEFIQSLPKGYDTLVGELGDKLSGGEKQRIGIARAFLSKAPLMLLDEPTSNLDSLNEGLILKSLYEAKGQTIVLVSHRKSTLGITSEMYTLSNQRR